LAPAIGLPFSVSILPLMVPTPCEAAKAANQAPVSTSGGLSEGARKAIQLAVDEARNS